MLDVRSYFIGRLSPAACPSPAPPHTGQYDVTIGKILRVRKRGLERRKAQNGVARSCRQEVRE